MMPGTKNEWLNLTLIIIMMRQIPQQSAELWCECVSSCCLLSSSSVFTLEPSLD